MLEHQKWVLIVEDESEIANGIADRVAKEGFRSIQCDTALEATNKLRNQRFDIIILDLRLKHGTGERVIEIIQTDPKLRSYDTPIIVISGHLDVKIVRNFRGKIAGAFVKPFQPSLLIAKIKEILEPPKKAELGKTG